MIGGLNMEARKHTTVVHLLTAATTYQLLSTKVSGGKV